MKYLFKILLALVAVAALPGCGDRIENSADVVPVNSIYHWKTVFELDSAELDFLKKHDIGRVYVRMFDVVPEYDFLNSTTDVVPIATTKFVSPVPAGVEIVPVTYITIEALRAMEGREEEFATLMVERMLAMCSYNECGKINELQLDCDWTTATKESYDKEDLRAFFNKLRPMYKKRGRKLMYIYRLEIGKRGGLHCHLVVNRIPDCDLLMRDAWTHASDEAGAIDFQTIDDSGGFGGLSEYLCKEPDEEIQGQIRFLIPEDKKKVYAVNSSRNLKRPEPVKKKYSHWTLKRILNGEEIKPTKGFYVDRDSVQKGINKFTGMSYLYYTEVRVKKKKRGEQDGQG